MREFLARLGTNDRVLLIGDTRQHQGVEAGRPFEQLQEAGMRTAKLDEIVRQKDPALKSAVELLATGQVSAALDALGQQGRVKEIPDQEERVRAIAKSYVESPENTLIVSPDNASRRELNAAVRQELKATGALAKEDHTFRVLVPRQDMTGAERSWASHYEIDDVVRYTRGSKTIGIEAGSYASVAAINPAANQLTVEKANGELATYDPRRLTGVSVYQEIERQFSVGDRIQFTAPDKSLGVANRELATIEAVASRWPPLRPPRQQPPNRIQRPASIAISTTATPSPATAPRASPPNASSLTPIPASTRTCSTPASATSPSPAPATRPRSSPTTWQSSARSSEPMSRRPPPWSSTHRHPSRKESRDSGSNELLAHNLMMEESQ